MQETFWDANLINSFVKFNCDGDNFFSNFGGDHFCKGIAVIFRHDCNVISVKEVFKGRILEAKIEYDDKMLYIYNVYTPNAFKERVGFFVDFNEYSHDKMVANDNLIVADFTMLMMGKIDRISSFPIPLLGFMMLY